MKLVTFYRNGENRLGMLRLREGQEVVYDLNQLDSSIPDNMIDFLSHGEKMIANVKTVIDEAFDHKFYQKNKIKLQAPVPVPSKIIGIGLNYRDHAIERNKPIPEYPLIFSKFSNSVIGPYDPIIIPKVTSRVDWECELGVVIGEKCRYVEQVDAMKNVAGYIAVNDVSARDYQEHSSQYTIGKTFDSFCPMGPSLVTLDEFQDPHSLEIKTILDGEVMQHSNTNQLIFSIPHLISYLSEVMTLMPGDIIMTGTPSGVGDNRDPQRYMTPGQVCRIEIDGIGVLENPVVAEQD